MGYPKRAPRWVSSSPSLKWLEQIWTLLFPSSFLLFSFRTCFKIVLWLLAKFEDIIITRTIINISVRIYLCKYGCFIHKNHQNSANFIFLSLKILQSHLKMALYGRAIGSAKQSHFKKSLAILPLDQSLFHVWLLPLFAHNIIENNLIQTPRYFAKVHF